MEVLGATGVELREELLDLSCEKEGKFQDAIPWGMAARVLGYHIEVILEQTLSKAF